jgi:hypothetical protein
VSFAEGILQRSPSDLREWLCFLLVDLESKKRYSVCGRKNYETRIRHHFASADNKFMLAEATSRESH